MSLDDATKVIGYFACNPPQDVFCDGDACVIAGSESAMKRYIAAMSPEALKTLRIAKTRFGEISRGMELGASYAFDEEAYNRFYPIANKNGCELKPEDFSIPTATGRHFVVVRST